MGRKKAVETVETDLDEATFSEGLEDEGDFEAAVTDHEGCGRQHGRRRVARGLSERESVELPDEPPPGYPG